MSNRTALRMRVLPRFPARISGASGIKVEQDNLDLVVSPDTPSLVQVPSISNMATTFFQAYNADLDSYSRISGDDLLENIQDVIIGENLAGIDALTVSANQVPYYLDGDGTAATYTVSSFVRGISDAADAAAFRADIGLAGAATLNVGTTAGTVAAGDDSRIVNAVQTSRTLTAGTGIATIGDLSANRTIALNSTAIASLALADTSVQPARTVSTGTGLTGGGDLSANRTFSLNASSIASLALADSSVQPGDPDSDLNFLQAGTSAVTRTTRSKLQDVLHAADFGFSTAGTAAANLAALQAAVNRAKALGCRLKLGPGTFDISGAIDIAACSNVWIDGDGEGTVIRTTSATAAIFSAAGATTISGFKLSNVKLSCSTTRTGTTPYILIDPSLQYSYFTDVSADNFNCFAWLKQFVQVQFSGCKLYQMSSPPTATYGIRAGTQAATNQGANLYIRDCIIRGNGSGSAASSNWTVGLLMHDVEGIFTLGLDLADWDSNARGDPQTRLANCFFDSSFFDATQRGPCFALQGAGVKVEIEFCASWFASAGRSGTPTASDGAYGFIASGAGEYGRVMFTGCRFYSNAGNGVAITSVLADIEFNGCNFYFNSKIDSGPSFYCGPTSTGGAVKLRNCTFLDSGGTDAVTFTSNASGYIVDGIHTDEVVSFTGSPRRIVNVTASNVAIAGLTVASAATLPIPPCGEFFTVTGTTTITAIAGSWAGHRITLLFASALTVTHGAPITLKGSVNASVPAGFTMDFVYNGSKWFETSRSF